MIIIIFQMKKKKIWVENIILIIYLSKVIDFLNQGKKDKVSRSQKKLLLKSGIKKTKSK